MAAQLLCEGIDAGLPNDEALRTGISRTAGVVTSAALVMFGVFSLFGTASSLDLKQAGVGLAVAVLLDATLDEAAVLLGDRVRSPLLRTVHYLDTPDLALARHGVIVRVRTPRGPEGRVGADVVVKVCGPSRRSRGLYRELDALPGATRFTASLARTRGAATAGRALVAPCPAARLLSA